jgi:two-component system response regulator NreC
VTLVTDDVIPATEHDAASASTIRVVIADDHAVVRRGLRQVFDSEEGIEVAAEPLPGPPDGLSEREVEVLRTIALGYTNAEIAEQLHLSVRTVETHRAHIQQKLRIASRSELVRYALEHKLVEPAS